VRSDESLTKSTAAKLSEDEIEALKDEAIGNALRDGSLVLSGDGPPTLDDVRALVRVFRAAGIPGYAKPDQEP